ncbi:MAG TPA: hypothetical protein DD636_01325, partial [Anaerolineaceae bacterium]|nr:hypothetical protein [Anaerolineaceae bacterium]
VFKAATANVRINKKSTAEVNNFALLFMAYSWLDYIIREISTNQDLKSKYLNLLIGEGGTKLVQSRNKPGSDHNLRYIR